jgi:hypothetical protein
MKALRRAAPWLSVLLATACASWRWSGYPPPTTASAPKHRQLPPGPDQDAAAPDDAALQVSTAPRADSARPVVPPTPGERGRSALFYSDMGPDSQDVSAYPAQQRYNYAIYQRACSRCHSLARSINAPFVGRGWWEFYMLGMRTRSRWIGQPLTKDETKAILDFLEYDARVRKVERAHEFDLVTEELKRRFDASLDARIRDMQKSNPGPLAPPPP